MNRYRLLGSLAAATAIGLSGLGAAHATMQSFTPLPTPDCGLTQANNCIQYGDFSVYSLALLYAQETYATTGTIPTTNPNPGDPFYVASSPGELGNNGYIVYGTGTNNNNVVTNGAGTLIDNAQEQPSGSGGGTAPPYVTGTSTETAPTFSGDLNTSWDGTLSAIRSELGQGSDPNGQFVIYFNLNETGNDGLAGIDLLSWLHLSIVDSTGTNPTQDFYLTGSPGSTTAPDVANNSDPNWVYVHGTICVSATAGFLGYGPCTAAQTSLGGRDINQNLGANEAAFALYNADLSNLVLNNTGYDLIRANWQLSNINNGYEQEFSALAPVGNNIPEPNTVMLLGLGLTVLGFGRRLRSRRRTG